MVLARNGYRRHATFAIEGKVDGTFGPLVKDWLGSAPSQGKRLRLAYLAVLVALDELQLGGIRYQLLHRTASAKIEAARNGSEVAAMLVRDWASNDEGLEDFSRSASLMEAEASAGRVGYSDDANVWLGWVRGTLSA